MFNAAISFNCTALLRLLAELFEQIGIKAGGLVQRLPRHVHLGVLRLLRPIEFALRRLIVVEARGLSVKTPAPGGGEGHAFPIGGILFGAGERAPLFSLFDRWPRLGTEPQRRFAKFEPRISAFGWDDYGPERIEPVETSPPSPDDLVGAERLCRRLEALRIALADLPKQAKRLARAEARRRNAPPGPKRVAPMRPGWPPGLRSQGRRSQRENETDEILRECHILAVRSLAAPEP